MKKPCEICGTIFNYKPSHEGRARFCSKRCLGVSNGQRAKATGNVFQPGLIPWSKTHAKGMHLSPGSEFKVGNIPANTAPVGTVRIKNDKNGTPRAFVKIAEPRTWKLRAVLSWESTHGPLPRGQLVHHVDRDSLNDDPSNLEAMNRRDHMLEHQIDLQDSRRAMASKRISQPACSTKPRP